MTDRREHGFLKAVWNRAIENAETTGVTKNPWAKVRCPKCHGRERVISLEEQAALMAHANDEYRRLLIVLLGTGMRIGEVLALRFRDVKQNHIHVRWETAKGEKSRMVPVLAAVGKAIKQQAAAKGCTQFSTEPLWNQSDWSVLKTLGRIVQRANKGFPKEQGPVRDHVTVHDMRRTFASRAAEAGMPIKRLAAILGHSSVSVTEKYYAHIDQRDNSAALAAVESGLGLSANTSYPAAK